MLKRRSTLTTTPVEPPRRAKRLDKLSESDLFILLEGEMMRNGELIRGFSHTELDQGWVLSQMLEHTRMQLACLEAIERKRVILQSL